MGSASGNLLKGEHRFLHRKIGWYALAGLTLLRERLAGHDARRHLGERDTGRLGHERHGARGARVHLEDVDHAALYRELDVHQADHVQRLGELARLRAQFVLSLLRQAVGRQRAPRIP